MGSHLARQRIDVKSNFAKPSRLYDEQHPSIIYHLACTSDLWDADDNFHIREKYRINK